MKLLLRLEPSKLVVDGGITTSPGPYTIRLSKSGEITSALNISQENQINNAIAVIKDDTGNSEQFESIGNGFYKTIDSSFRGKAGREYHLEISLSDGSKFLSRPEKIPAVVAIDSFKIRFVPHYNLKNPTYFRTYIYTKDPIDQENYYKWDFYSFSRRETYGIGCGPWCVIFQYCHQRQSDNELNIVSDASINGNSIVNYGIGNSYIFTFGTHFIEFAQASITREYYQFLKLYGEQRTRTGSTLDPLPASIKGNIYNAANPEEFAFGYFNARSEVRKRVIILPDFLTQYIINVTADAFFEKVSRPCFDVYPNTLRYDPPPAIQVPPPPGWENADTVRVVFKFP